MPSHPKKKRKKTKLSPKPRATRGKAKAAPLTNDLNAKFSSAVQAERRAPHSFDNVSNLSILFDGIERHLVQLITHPRVHFCLVSAPWCSSKAILAALATKRGVGILTQPDKHSQSAVRRQAYGALAPFQPGMDRVRGLRIGRGRQQSILHQKCVVLLDSDRSPLGAATGSFNLSGANGSSTNIENMIVVNDHRVAAELTEEWRRVYSISRRMFE